MTELTSSRNVAARQKIRRIRRFVRRSWMTVWVVALALVAMSAFAAISDYQTVRRGLRHEVTLAAEGAAQSLRFVIKGIGGEFDSIGRFIRGRPEGFSLRDSVRYQAERLGVGHVVFVMNALGRVIATSDPGRVPLGASFSKEAFFAMHRQTANDIGLYLGAPVQERGLPLSRALHGKKGEMIGIAAAFLDAKSVQAFLPPSWGAEGGIHIAVRFEGKVFAAMPPIDEDGDVMMKEWLEQSRDGLVRPSWGEDRTPHLVSIRKVTPWPLTAEAGIEIMPALDGFRLRALIWTGFTALAVAAMVLGILLHVRELRRRLLQAAVIERKNVDLHRANTVKTEFIAHVSHELRTPLNAVIGFAETLEREIHGPLSEKQKDHSRSIGVAGRHLLSLVNDLLDLSVIDSGGMMLKEEAVDLGAVAREMEALVQPFIEATGLHLKIKVEDGLPKIKADNRKLHQILLNLIGNSIKFTPKGGEIEVTVASQKKPRGLMVSVRDTGRGIAPKDIPLVLSPFGRVQRASIRAQEGVGLGLPLTKRLIELHGGIMEIDSIEGQGTTVKVWLPGERIMQ